jgi:hypothetical protein
MFYIIGIKFQVNYPSGTPYANLESSLRTNTLAYLEATLVI